MSAPAAPASSGMIVKRGVTENITKSRHTRRDRQTREADERSGRCCFFLPFRPRFLPGSRTIGRSSVDADADVDVDVDVDVDNDVLENAGSPI